MYIHIDKIISVKRFTSIISEQKIEPNLCHHASAETVCKANRTFVDRDER